MSGENIGFFSWLWDIMLLIFAFGVGFDLWYNVLFICFCLGFFALLRGGVFFCCGCVWCLNFSFLKKNHSQGSHSIGRDSASATVTALVVTVPWRPRIRDS